MTDYMLTTVDNPHDPRLDFTAWYKWDIANGYDTCSFIDRLALVGEDFPEEIQHAQIEEAMDRIIELHDGGLYKKLPVDDAA